MQNHLLDNSTRLQSSLFRRREHGQYCPENRTGNSAIRSSENEKSNIDDKCIISSNECIESRHNYRRETNLTQSRESENDVLMQALLSDLRAAKNNFKSLNKEVNFHNSLLDNLGRRFTEARMSLGATMRSLDRIGLSSFKHMWILFIFIVIFFILIYLMLRFRR